MNDHDYDEYDERSPLYIACFESPIGRLLAGATAQAVTLLEYSDDRTCSEVRAALEQRFGRPVTESLNPHLMLLESELGMYFAGVPTRFSVPLDFSTGTPFQQEVWSALLTIPYGETRSYRDIAASLSKPAAARAIGRANGQNRITIVVPCHRVVFTGSALGGYSGGLWRKRHLLDLERGQRTLSLS